MSVRGLCPWRPTLRRWDAKFTTACAENALTGGLRQHVWGDERAGSEKQTWLVGEFDLKLLAVGGGGDKVRKVRLGVLDVDLHQLRVVSDSV